MIRCKSCGSENNDNLAFCIDCGSEKSPSQASVSSNPTPVSPTQDIVSSTKVACPHCQKLNSFYLTFCDHCGKNMKYDDCNQRNFLSREELKLTGIGGWLIFPIIGLFLYVVAGILSVLLPLAIEYGFVYSPDNYMPLINFSIAYNVFYAIICVIALVLLFMKKKIAPKIVIGLYILPCLFYLVLTMKTSLSFGVDTASMLKEMIGSVIYACIWIPYFLISKRVKYTFTK